MRIKVPIDLEQLVELKEQGWSYAMLARKFKVSEKTIVRRFREMVPRDPEMVKFSNTLAELATAAPEGYCKKELWRLIMRIRTLHLVSDLKKKQKIIDSLGTGACEIEEIAEDCNFSKDDTKRLLELLEGEKIIFKQQRGGILNAGRKMKFRYFLTTQKNNISPTI